MLDRDLMERLALDRVCACLYYDLADNMETTSDEELLVIIWEMHMCVHEQELT